MHIIITRRSRDYRRPAEQSFLGSSGVNQTCGKGVKSAMFSARSLFLVNGGAVSRNSVPCSRARLRTLPNCFFQVCVSSLILLTRSRAQLRCCPRRLLFAPASRRNSFPTAQSANERVSALVSPKLDSFLQFEDGVVAIVASKLMTRFF